jgi:hypothetical protein
MARLWVTRRRTLLLLLLMIARSGLAAAAVGNVQVQGRRPQSVFACDSDTEKLNGQRFWRSRARPVNAAAARLCLAGAEPRVSEVSDSLCGYI